MDARERTIGLKVKFSARKFGYMSATKPHEQKRKEDTAKTKIIQSRSMQGNYYVELDLKNRKISTFKEK